MITQKYLKSVLSYDENTGLFSKLTKSWKFNIGDTLNNPRPDGYITLGIKNNTYLAHRLAWLYVYGKFPKNNLDHINGNRADNRICNLREVTQSQNSMNRTKQSNNTSGIKGVTWDKQCNKWKAQIKYNGKVKNLGVFRNIEDAEAVVKEARIKFHNDYAKD